MTSQKNGCEGDWNYSGMRGYFNTLLSNFCPIICQISAYQQLKTIENFRPLALTNSGRDRLRNFEVV